jgi:hypothetical protein
MINHILLLFIGFGLLYFIWNGFHSYYEGLSPSPSPSHSPSPNGSNKGETVTPNPSLAPSPSPVSNQITISSLTYKQEDNNFSLMGTVSAPCTLQIKDQTGTVLTNYDISADDLSFTIPNIEEEATGTSVGGFTVFVTPIVNGKIQYGNQKSIFINTSTSISSNTSSPSPNTSSPSPNTSSPSSNTSSPSSNTSSPSSNTSSPSPNTSSPSPNGSSTNGSSTSFQGTTKDKDETIIIKTNLENQQEIALLKEKLKSYENLVCMPKPQPIMNYVTKSENVFGPLQTYDNNIYY